MIKIQKVSKVYKLYATPMDRLKEALSPWGKKYHTNFHALKDINLSINKGETIGIIGKNGAGKSTLLNILTGVLTPTAGEYQIPGKVASLLELGAGFNPELTGLENVYFYGSILGYTKNEMDQKQDAILDFAHIGDFINQPVKTYSSGMYVRLAFAIAIHTDPDVLIIDETLAVGDIRFQLKCFRMLEKIKKKGTTICLVSHDMGMITNQCDRVIWLDNGQIRAQGLPTDVCPRYVAHMTYDAETTVVPRAQKSAKKVTKITNEIPWQSTHNHEYFGDQGAEITHIACYETKNRKPINTLMGGEKITIALKIKVNREIQNPIVGFYLTDPQGNNILGTNTFVAEKAVPPLYPDKIFRTYFSFPFPELHNDHYHLTVAIADGTQQQHVQHHWIHDVLMIKVHRNTLSANHGSRLILSGINIDYDH